MKRAVGLLTLLFLLVPLSQAALTDDLVEYFSMDDANVSGTTLIGATKSFNCTLTGGANSSNNGIINTSTGYSGTSQYAACGNNANVGSNGSLSAWFKTETLADDGEVIITKGGSGTPGTNVAYTCYANSLTVSCEVGDGASTKTTIRYYHQGTINTDTWYHVGFVWNSTNASLYVNGTLRNESGLNAVPGDNSNALRFAAWNSLTKTYELDGRLDEIGLWTEPLNESTISQLYNNGSGCAYPFTTLCGSNTTPSVSSVTIETIPYVTSDPLEGFCTVADPDQGANITYSWKWFENGILFSNTTNGTSSSPGLNLNLENISSGNLSAGEEWVFSCQGVDETGRSSGYVNSSTATITLTNYLNVSFRNETTDLPLTGVNVTLNIIGDTNFTFLNDTSVIFVNQTVIPGNYTLKYSAEGYSSRDYFITLTQNSQNVTLYLLIDDFKSVLPVTITDSQGTFVNDAVLHWKRFFSNTSLYLVVEMSETTENGHTNLFFEKYDAWYELSILHKGVIVKTINPKRYTATDAADGIQIAIEIEENPFQSLFPVQTFFSTYDTITHDATVDTFTYTYADTSNIIQEVCLSIYEWRRSGRVISNSTCSSANSATIITGYSNPNNRTLEAVAEVETNTANSPYQPAKLIIEVVSDGVAIFGQMGLFVAVIMMSSLTLISTGSIVIPIIMTIVGLGAMVIGLDLGITLVSVLSIAVIGLGIIGLMGWRKDR